MTDRAPIEVEVVCHQPHNAPVAKVSLLAECGECGEPITGNPGWQRATLAPGSLDEARMRLADAVELRYIAWQEWDAVAESDPECDEAVYERYCNALGVEEWWFHEVRRLREAANGG